MAKVNLKNSEIEEIVKIVLDELACRSEIFVNPPFSTLEIINLTKNYEHLEKAALHINSIYGAIVAKDGLNKLVKAVAADVNYIKDIGGFSEKLENLLSSSKFKSFCSISPLKPEEQIR